MPIDLKKSRASFSKLQRQLAKLKPKTAPTNVHKFRTTCRRVEVLLEEVPQKPAGNTRKLLKLLARLRKKAGKVRDLDVQISTLGTLKISGGNGDKTQFIESLVHERAKSENRLADACDRKTKKEVRQRLKRAAAQLDLAKEANPLALALNLLAQLGRDRAPLTEKSLHQYRIVGKRARYIAELDPENPETKHLIDNLKSLQDVIGDWHDWLKMTQKAEALLGGARNSALVAMLQNVTRAKYRQALDVVSETRTQLAKPVAVVPAPERKPVSRHHTQAASAA